MNYRKEIVYDRETRDYAMYLDNELVGFARTYHEAEVTLDQLVFKLMSGEYFRETPAAVLESDHTNGFFFENAPAPEPTIDFEAVCDICSEAKPEEAFQDDDSLICNDCRRTLIEDEIQTQQTLRIYAA